MNTIMNIVRNTPTIPDIDASKALIINSDENRSKIHKFNNGFSELIGSITE